MTWPTFGHVPVVAFVDVDGTLLAQTTTFLFARILRRRGMIKSSFILRALYHGLQHRFGRLDYGRLVAFGLKSVSNVPISEGPPTFPTCVTTTLQLWSVMSKPVPLARLIVTVCPPASWLQSKVWGANGEAAPSMIVTEPAAPWVRPSIRNESTPLDDVSVASAPNGVTETPSSSQLICAPLGPPLLALLHLSDKPIANTSAPSRTLLMDTSVTVAAPDSTP